MKAAGKKRFDVAVFPLVDAVLFPGTVLPLHINEEAHDQMVRDIQRRGWPLAVSLVIPGKGTNEFALNPICGAGAVQVYKEYPDGCSDILVHGQQRIRLCSIVQQHPYFIMEAEPILADPVKESPFDVDHGDLLGLVKSWMLANPKVAQDTIGLVEQFSTVGELCDFFAFYFVERLEDKQDYLNCPYPGQRAGKLTDFLERDLARLTRKLMKTKNSFVFH